MTPHWGRVKPFAAHDFRSYHLHTPPRFGTPEFAALTAELLDFSANLTDTTKTISEYWAYDFNSMSPPGHWNLFAQYVIARDSVGLVTVLSWCGTIPGSTGDDPARSVAE